MKLVKTYIQTSLIYNTIYSKDRLYIIIFKYYFIYLNLDS
jgi:hypothetical protein